MGRYDRIIEELKKEPGVLVGPFEFRNRIVYVMALTFGRARIVMGDEFTAEHGW